MKETSFVRMGAVSLDAASVTDLRAESTRLGGGVDLSDAAYGIDGLTVALQPLPDGAGQICAYYVLGDSATAVASVFETGQSNLLGRLADGEADLIFHWEDEQRPAAERGMAIPVLSVIPLSEDSATKMRTLVQEMKARHLGGLAARARAVGYYREAMALARMEDGQWVLMVYLELVDPETPKRIQTYPDDEFTSWWNPQFRGLVGMGLATARSETLLRWSRAVGPARMST